MVNMIINYATTIKIAPKQTKNALLPKSLLKQKPMVMHAKPIINTSHTFYAISANPLKQTRPFKLIINYTGDVK